MAVQRVGGAGEEGANACSERFLFSLLKEKNVMILYCPYCINIRFQAMPRCYVFTSVYPSRALVRMFCDAKDTYP